MNNTRRQIHQAIELLSSGSKRVIAACFAWMALFVAGAWFVAVMTL